jgi:hypothetical protein
MPGVCTSSQQVDVAVGCLLHAEGQVLVGPGQYDAAHEKSFS